MSQNPHYQDPHRTLSFRNGRCPISPSLEEAALLHVSHQGHRSKRPPLGNSSRESENSQLKSSERQERDKKQGGGFKKGIMQ